MAKKEELCEVIEFANIIGEASQMKKSILLDIIDMKVSRRETNLKKGSDVVFVVHNFSSNLMSLFGTVAYGSLIVVNQKNA